LANAIADARALGQDIGSALALQPYARASVAANAPMMAALDALQKIFAEDAYPVALARSLGLAAVNAAGPIRRKIAWYAMGGA
jgi:ubiquinone biosynthesis monooxygenase Coq6